MIMKKHVLCLAGLMLFSGCSPGGGKINMDLVNRSVENLTEITALIAFARDDVKPHVSTICLVTAEVSKVLENFDDPDATFEALRIAALITIENLPPDVLPDSLRPLVILVVDQVLSVVFFYVRDAYGDLIERDESTVVLSVARSIARGLKSTCAVTPFSLDSGFGQFTVEKK
jgi:hypothetical protein